jgi:hypothetical protein
MSRSEESGHDYDENGYEEDCEIRIQYGIRAVCRVVLHCAVAVRGVCNIAAARQVRDRDGQYDVRRAGVGGDSMADRIVHFT